MSKGLYAPTCRVARGNERPELREDWHPRYFPAPHGKNISHPLFFRGKKRRSVTGKPVTGKPGTQPCLRACRPVLPLAEIRWSLLRGLRL
jgi:hypothetical protein